MSKQRDMTKYQPLHDLMVNLDYYYSCLEAQPSGCIVPIRGGRHSQGYLMMGAVRITDNQSIMTTGHRIAARMKFNRAIASSEFVIHTCSNMACCNPDHLILGDRADIHKVMKKNKRYAGHYGGGRQIKPQNRQYKYTVEEMKFVLSHTSYEVADRFVMTVTEAGKLKHRMRRGYEWLVDYNEDGTKIHQDNNDTK